MTKEAFFTVKLEPELHDAFMAAAEAAHRPASQVVRELMRDYIERQREEQAYDEFLRRKVALSDESIQAGRVHSNEEVEAEFAVLRASVKDDEQAYREFLREKVELARVSMRAGRGTPNEEVAAKFAALRTSVQQSPEASDPPRPAPRSQK